MKKPVLVVMAAGMGSRYGGLKQIDPIDKDGDTLSLIFLSMMQFRQGLKKLYLL